MLEMPAGSVFGGRYTVVECIGSGGMGAVYLATDPRYRDFEVALKVLYPGIIKTPEARERFRTEIIASYKIAHRNIVRAYGFFDEENVQAYAMEYVSGGDLQHRMRDGGIPLEETMSILRQATAGLHAIHGQGIIHRDLKPENILINQHGRVKIGDFGVAQMRESNTSLTQIGAMVGTPKYFSPEYIETGETDHRGDVYALGVIGYELLAGISPFRSDSRIGMMVERIKRPQEPLSSVAPHCPPELAKVIEKAMAVSIFDRYQSAEEMRQDIALIEEGKPPLYARDFVETDVPEPVSEVLRESVTIKSFQKKEEQQQALATPVAFRQSSPAKPKTLIAAGLAVLFSLPIILFLFLFSGSAADLSVLQPGVYEGVVKNIDPTGKLYKLTFWKSAAGGVAVHVNRGDCEASRLDDDNMFSCNNFGYELDVQSANDVSALGDIRVRGGLRWGSWSVTRKLELEG